MHRKLLCRVEVMYCPITFPELQRHTCIDRCEPLQSMQYDFPHLEVLLAEHDLVVKQFRFVIDLQIKCSECLFARWHEFGDKTCECVLAGFKCFAETLPGDVGGQFAGRYPRIEYGVAGIRLRSRDVPEFADLIMKGGVASLKTCAQCVAGKVCIGVARIEITHD